MDALQKKVNALIADIAKALEGRIDFEGQREAESLNQHILIVSTFLAFGLGYAAQSLHVTFGVYALGFLGALFVVVPPWPRYNKNPIKWLPPLPEPAKKQDKAKVP